jgi:methionyl aminopeptidase
MVTIKTAREIERMRVAGKIASEARKLAGSLIRPGIPTRSIDREVRAFLKSCDAIPSFLGYNGYPAGVCISINEEVIHGIPGSRKIVDGDIVSIDVGAYIGGFHGDCAATYVVGECSPEDMHLLDVCRTAFFTGMSQVRKGNRIGDISTAIQEYVESRGCAIVRDYVGHGVGRKLHEDPEIPNFADSARRGIRIMPGMTFAIEPMVNRGTAETLVKSDGWTVVTADGARSAHYENTVLATDGEPEILTPLAGDGFV